MKIGIVSDIHSNAGGLNRALELMGDVDELLCLGDCVTEYRFSNEVIATLRGRGARVVQGNHDAGYLKHLAGKPSQDGKADPELVGWLREQPERLDLEFAGKSFVMVHAAPWTRDYVSPGSPEMKRFAEVDADFVLGGHTHTPFAGRIGRALVLNPGSVGQARYSVQNPDRELTCIVLDPHTDDAQVLAYPEILAAPPDQFV